MKRFLLVVLATGLIAALACGSAAANVIKLKYGHVGSKTPAHVCRAVCRTGPGADRRAGDHRIYPNAQLGQVAD